MKIINLAVLGCSLAFGTAVAQEEAPQVEHEMQIKVITEGSDGTSTINWTSTDGNLDFHDMQVGESRSIIDDDGRSVLVTKTEDGLTFNIDGEEVVMPDIATIHSSSIAMVSVDAPDAMDHDVDVQVIAPHAMATPVSGGTMIVTSEPLDAATQESIRAVLQSAGSMDEVTFVDRSNANRAVHVVKKQIEVKQ